MKRLTWLKLAIGLLLALALTRPAAAQDLLPTTSVLPGSIYFDDSHPDLIVLGNTNYYEIGFRKANGSIAYINDKRGTGNVTAGSRYGCLWGVVFEQPEPTFFGGCNFSPAGPNRFTYNWSATARTLTFTYTPDPGAARRVNATVTIKPTENAWLDMRLIATNRWGEVMDWALFPCDTVFVEDEIREALLPILPGVMLTPQFFAENRSYMTRYPGYPGVFADFVWLATTNGTVTMYSLQGGGPIRPLDLGFVHDEEYLPDTVYFPHSFAAMTANGGSFTTPWVRLRVGDEAMAAIQGYRADNGIGAYRSLRQKLGARYDQLAAAPLYKADSGHLGVPFRDYGPILNRLPVPGILHPVAFQPGGHDENYPDFLPPAATWGTTAEMAAMFRQAQARGLLVMPYTNPTWWDDGSPTLTSLPAPLTIRDVAVLDRNRDPVYEWYGPHGGYVMSPYPSFVQNRLSQLVQQMTTDVPSDLLFEDQIGARPWLHDYNSASPSPTAYMEGWLAHTRVHHDKLLMTELGFDRLAETEVGFHGSVLLPAMWGGTDEWWGAGTWRPYPLATALARDKALFYQHDLAPETFTTRKEILTWNLAMGYMLSYDLAQSEFGGGLESEWLGLVSAFQKWALAAYADQQVTGYADLVPSLLTRTDFETCQVYANWTSAHGWMISGHGIVENGVMVTCNEGALVAGIFKWYSNTRLSAGDHYLIEARGDWGAIVRQPIGADTDLTLAHLPAWRGQGPTSALAINATGQVVGSVPVTVGPNGLTFRYTRILAGQAVDAYWLPNPRLYLPLIRR